MPLLFPLENCFFIFFHFLHLLSFHNKQFSSNKLYSFIFQSQYRDSFFSFFKKRRLIEMVFPTFSLFFVLVQKQVTIIYQNETASICCVCVCVWKSRYIEKELHYYLPYRFFPSTYVVLPKSKKRKQQKKKNRNYYCQSLLQNSLLNEKVREKEVIKIKRFKCCPMKLSIYYLSSHLAKRKLHFFHTFFISTKKKTKL